MPRQLNHRLRFPPENPQQASGFLALSAELHCMIGSHLPLRDFLNLLFTSRRLSELYSDIYAKETLEIKRGYSRTMLRYVEGGLNLFRHLRASDPMGRWLLSAMARTKRTHLLVEISDTFTVNDFIDSLTALSKTEKNHIVPPAGSKQEAINFKPEIIITLEARDFSSYPAEHQVHATEIAKMIEAMKSSEFFLIKLNIKYDVVHAGLDMQHIEGIALRLPPPMAPAAEGHQHAECPSFSGTLLLNEAWQNHQAKNNMHIFPNASSILWIGRQTPPLQNGSLEALQAFENLRTLHIQLSGSETIEYAGLISLTSLSLEITRNRACLAKMTLPPGLRSLTIFIRQREQSHDIDCSADELLKLLDSVPQLDELVLINVRLGNFSSHGEKSHTGGKKLLDLPPRTLRRLTLFRVHSALELGSPHHSLMTLDVRHCSLIPLQTEYDHTHFRTHDNLQGLYAIVDGASSQLTLYTTGLDNAMYQTETKPGSELRAFSGPISRLQTWHPDHLRILKIEDSHGLVHSLADYHYLEELDLPASALSKAAAENVYDAHRILSVLPIHLKLLRVDEMPCRESKTVWHFRSLSHLQELVLSLSDVAVTSRDLPDSLILVALPYQYIEPLRRELIGIGRKLAVRVTNPFGPFFNGQIAELNEEIQTDNPHPSYFELDMYWLHHSMRRFDLPQRRSHWLESKNRSHSLRQAYYPA